MCLTLEPGAVRKRASIDIPCWKVFEVFYDDKDQILYSPYQGFDYIEGQHYVGDLSTNILGYEIHKGFHSYSKLSRAMELEYLLNCHMGDLKDRYYVVIECIIPKGSDYYLNKWRFQLASKEIIIGYRNKIKNDEHKSKRAEG
jgi:hypothetical protein